jgi:hypothetical protein
MTSKKIWLVMLALIAVLALGLTVVGCTSPTDNENINIGTEIGSDLDDDADADSDTDGDTDTETEEDDEEIEE